MDQFQGVLGIAVIFGLVFAVSKYRTRINWRILGAGFALQVITAFLILKWEPGFQALQALSGGVSWPWRVGPAKPGPDCICVLSLCFQRWP